MEKKKGKTDKRKEKNTKKYGERTEKAEDFFFLLSTFRKRLKLLRDLPKWKLLPRKG